MITPTSKEKTAAAATGRAGKAVVAAMAVAVAADDAASATLRVLAFLYPSKSPQNSRCHKLVEAICSSKIVPLLEHEENHSQLLWTI